MFGLKASELIAVRSITKKFNLGAKELKELISAHNSGKSEDEILAQFLKAPEGVDPREYIESQLSPSEQESLNSILNKYTKGKGLKE